MSRALPPFPTFTKAASEPDPGNREKRTTLTPSATANPSADELAPRATEPPRQAFVLTDVYTSDAAAENAYVEKLQAQALAQQIFGEDDSSVPQIPESFVGLFDAFAQEDASEWAALNEEPSGPSLADQLREPDVLNRTLSPAAQLAAQQEVTVFMEAFLRDTFRARDADAYLDALDEDFQYTHNSGTPDDPSDDRSYRGIGYEQIGIHRLFERFDSVAVGLSKPRDFNLIRPGVAEVTYDYDMRFRNRTEARRIAGTASFLLMRGGAQGNSSDWRIVEWYDMPPRLPDASRASSSSPSPNY
jgi:hypothetical protein